MDGGPDPMPLIQTTVSGNGTRIACLKILFRDRGRQYYIYDAMQGSDCSISYRLEMGKMVPRP